MRRTSVALRTVLVVDAAVFLVAAALNAGVHIPLASATLRFAAPVWRPSSTPVSLYRLAS